MKPYILSILCSLMSLYSFSQSMLGVDAGASRPSFIQLPFSEVNSSKERNASGGENTGALIGITYLRTDSIHPHFYWGAKLYLQQYSFDRRTRSGGNGFGDHIIHKSSYIFAAPTIDLAAGRKQVRHFHIQLGVGYLIDAHEQTDVYQYPIGSGHSFSSTKNVSRFLFQPGIGFSQHVRVHKNWDIVFTEGGNIMIGNLTMVDGVGLHPSSVYITAGLTRVFNRLPMPPKPPKKEKKPFKSRIY